jgi:WD40 repeat protein
VLSTTSTTFTVGGTVQAGGGLYLTRAADDELLTLCRDGAFAYVLTARQMGKSSLMVRAAARLADEGIRSVTVDLSLIGVNVTTEEWYFGLISLIDDQLMLEVDLAAWWTAHQQLSVSQRLTQFFADVVLNRVEQPVVVFVDEIDTTLSLRFTDDFFALIRYLYNARAQDPRLRRLSFVLIGVAAPSDLIRDPGRTPFNIGRRVELADFTFEDALPLADGLGLPGDQARAVLGWALEWTNGHPYLTQRLCNALHDVGPAVTAREDVARVVHALFIGDAGDRDNNLQFVRDMLTVRAPRGSEEAVLTTYRAVLRRDSVPDDDQSVVKSHLKLAGAVRVGDGALTVRNRIYESAFNEKWIGEHLPVNWRRRIQRAATFAALAFMALCVPLAILAAVGWMQADEQRRLAEASWQQAVHAEMQARQAAEERADAAREAEMFARVAEEQANLAIEAASVAKESLKQTVARALEARALLLRSQQPAQLQTSLLLAEESVRRGAPGSTSGALQLISQGLALLPQPSFVVRHDDAVRSVAFSSSGRYLATGGNDGVVRVWDATRADTPPLVQLKHDRAVNIVAFNGHETLLASGSEDGSARTWRVPSGEPMAREDHGGPVTSVTFSPDNTTVASGGVGATAHVWNGESGGSVITHPLQHRSGVSAVAFDASGTHLASASSDRFAYVWDLENVDAPRAQLEHDDGVRALAFSPDSSILATASADSTARLWRWEVSDNSDVRELRHDGAVNSVAFSIDSQNLATASADNSARIWDVATGRLLHRVVHQGVVRAVAFSASGQLLATASADGTARVWDLNNRAAEAARIIHDPGPSGETAVNAVMFSPSQERWIATAGDDRAARVWEVGAGQDIQELRGHADAIYSAAFDARGLRIVTASHDATARIWDVQRPRDVSVPLRGHDGVVWSAAFDPTGSELATAGDDGTVRIWNDAGQQLQTLNAVAPRGVRAAPAPAPADRAPILAVAYSRDGLYLAGAGNDGSVHVWDVPRGVTLATLPAHSGPAMSADFNPDGTLLVTAGLDRLARIWRLSASQLGPEDSLVLEHDAPVLRAAFSPDGSRVVTASAGGTARIWDAASGNLLVGVSHTAAVNSAEFSPDGQTIVTASDDRTVRIWDAATGAQLAVERGLPSAMKSASFSPNGLLVVSGGVDGLGRIWAWKAQTGPENLVDVCSRVTRNLNAAEWQQYLLPGEPYSKTCPTLP